MLLPQSVTALEFGLVDDIEEYFLWVKSAWDDARENAGNTGLDKISRDIIDKYVSSKGIDGQKHKTLKHKSIKTALAYQRRKEVTTITMPELSRALKNQVWELITNLEDDKYYWIKAE